ncbi:MAG: ribosome small subunit-dependent GTPase A [Acidobacteriota bacterium]
MDVDLATLGWDASWADVFRPHEGAGLEPARVAIEYNHIYRLVSARGELKAEHAGRLRHQAQGRHELAAVGDWVAVRVPAVPHAHATIEAILPRRSKFSRKVAGALTEEQVVAANIDVVFLVMGLDRDYNPRRLERYLLLARDSGARPVVILSKADLRADLDAVLDEIRALAPGVPVHATSATARLGLEAIVSALPAGRTGALLGSSGAGKSTLINAIAGRDLQQTREVRAKDSRGRHTTRHRQLISLPHGGLIIDTPGMRELQLWDVGGAVQDAFDDIDGLAIHCHFTDCRHAGEPRCAVKAAVDAGELAPERHQSYLKLHEELEALEARKDVRARIDSRRQGRTMAKALKELYRVRDHERR